jgi:hypothetical protein
MMGSTGSGSWENCCVVGEYMRIPKFVFLITLQYGHISLTFLLVGQEFLDAWTLNDREFAVYEQTKFGIF